jgi:hypothetical protein
MQDGQLRYKRAKERRQMVVDKHAVDILKWGVEHERLKVQRQDETITKRTDRMGMQEATLSNNCARLKADKQIHS